MFRWCVPCHAVDTLPLVSAAEIAECRQVVIGWNTARPILRESHTHFGADFGLHAVSLQLRES